MTIPYPDIDPVAVQLGPFAIRWYALAYIAGIFLGWRYLISLLRTPRLWGGAGPAPVEPKREADAKSPVGPPPQPGPPMWKTQLDDIVFWVTLGVILGGRLGYVVFYEPAILTQPWVSLATVFGLGDGLFRTLIGWIHLPPAIMLWNGGMSFHGGLIGVTLAGYLFSRRNRLEPWRVGDLFACAAPIGLFFGRMANFINGELWGRPSDVPWAMVFPADSLQVPRHPSQLYEAALEGIALFVVMRLASHHFGVLKRPSAAIGVFLAGYGLSRVIVENFRQPDSHMPDFPLGLTMGMILSLPMIAGGLFLLLRARKGAGAGAGAA